MALPSGYSRHRWATPACIPLQAGVSWSKVDGEHPHLRVAVCKWLARKGIHAPIRKTIFLLTNGWKPIIINSFQGS